MMDFEVYRYRVYIYIQTLKYQIKETTARPSTVISFYFAKSELKNSHYSRNCVFIRQFAYSNVYTGRPELTVNWHGYYLSIKFG